MNNQISLYTHNKHSQNCRKIDTEFIFQDIKEGKYQDQVSKIRLAKINFKKEEQRCEPNKTKEDKEYNRTWDILEELKNKIPRYTISGLFSDEGRSEVNLIKHSGLIDIDLDGVDNLEQIKNLLILDKYCYSCFMSCGGDGLAFIVKIDPKKHKESYDGLCEYLFKTYSITGIDPTHKNPANTRNMSFDPDIFINEKSILFKEYPKEKKKEILKFVHVQKDFEDIIKEIVRRGLDICDTYEDYRDIGFAIGNKFGLDGEYYFHELCKSSLKYNQKKCTKDYKYFCKPGGITIGTFYAKCIELNIPTSSESTQLISRIASTANRTGKTKEDTIKNLEKHEGIKRQDCEDIINQVFDNKIIIANQEGLIPDIKLWIKHTYNLKRNSITEMLECDGKQMTDEDQNSLILECKQTFQKATTALIKEIINSNSIESNNPIQDWFFENVDKIPIFDIDEIPQIVLDVWDCFKTPNKDYMIKFGTKFLVQLIAAAHYDPDSSTLMLILQGGIGTGKSFFGKNLLPDKLKHYRQGIKWINEKDDQVSLCHNWLCQDDELESHSKKMMNQMKAILGDNDYFTRRPFKELFIRMKRLACIIGTTNQSQILDDIAGNRRYIILNVLSLDRDKFSKIDKDELFMALYQMYKNGFNFRIDEEERKDLNANTEDYVHNSLEFELITKYFEKPKNGFNEDYMTTSDVKVYLDLKAGQKLSLNKVGAELNRLGFEKKSVRVEDTVKKMYLVSEKSKFQYKEEEKKENPF